VFVFWYINVIPIQRLFWKIMVVLHLVASLILSTSFCLICETEYTGWIFHLYVPIWAVALLKLPLRPSGMAFLTHSVRYCTYFIILITIKLNSHRGAVGAAQIWRWGGQSPEIPDKAIAGGESEFKRNVRQSTLCLNSDSIFFTSLTMVRITSKRLL